MFHHVVSRRVAILIVGLSGMILGCADATSSVMPRSSSSTPTSPTPTGPALLSLSPSSGPTIGGDYIRLSGSGFQSGATVALDGVAARVTRMTANVIDARTAAHATGAVDVVITNPDGQTATMSGGYTFGVFSVTGGPNIVAPGGELSVSWVAPSGRGCSGGGDWIAIYRVGDPDDTGAANGHSDLWYEHLCGATSGTWRLKAPDNPAVYEFRYMVGDFSVARSNAITVR
jgi:hypothetical protein